MNTLSIFTPVSVQSIITGKKEETTLSRELGDFMLLWWRLPWEICNCAVQTVKKTNLQPVQVYF